VPVDQSGTSGAGGRGRLEDARQVALAAAEFARFVPWLMPDRGPLDVPVQPETGDDLADHRNRAMWSGEELPLRLEAFGESG
jgi:aromatic ring-cleaving dioxygenase